MNGQVVVAGVPIVAAANGSGVWNRLGTVLASTNENAPLWETGAHLINLVSHTTVKVFKDWYTANGGMWYAESVDAVSWTISPARLAGLDGYVHPEILEVGATKYLFVVNAAGESHVDLFSSADDGVTWTLVQANVIALGGAGTWNDTHLYTSKVWADTACGATYCMLLEAYGSLNPSDVSVVGLLKSSDLTSWSTATGATNPVMNFGGGFAYCHPELRKVGSTYYAWIHTDYGHGGTYMIALTTSTDLHTWTTPVQVMYPRTAGEYAWIGNPRFAVTDAYVYLFYNSQSFDDTITDAHVAVAAMTVAQLVQTPEGDAAPLCPTCQSATGSPIASNTIVMAYNAAGGTMAAGRAVAIQGGGSGLYSGIPVIWQASSQTTTRLPFFGVMADSVPNNTWGRVYTSGVVTTDNLDTRGSAIGNLVYLNTSSTSFTLTAPSAGPGGMQTYIVGYVASLANPGNIFLAPNRQPMAEINAADFGSDTWRRYYVAKIANGVSGCGTTNGCWRATPTYQYQDGTPVVTAASAALTQDIPLFSQPTHSFVSAIRVKTGAACSGTATVQVTDLGNTTNSQFFATGLTYDLKAAVGGTNILNVPMAALGGVTDDAMNMTMRITTTVSNVDQIAAGCAMYVWVRWGILP